MIIVFIKVDSFDYVTISQYVFTRDEQIGLAFFFFIPFAVKVPMFPFHL